MDGSASGLFAMVGFGIGGVEPLYSATRELVQMW